MEQQLFAEAGAVEFKYFFVDFYFKEPFDFNF
jgi:hypothetical protein